MLLIGIGLIAVGYALYYAAQAFGVEATTAGNYVQLFIFLVICVGYTSTYIFRVANKVTFKLFAIHACGSFCFVTYRSAERLENAEGHDVCAPIGRL